MWQKCPICQGTGLDPTMYAKQCPTCKGQRIISEVTGKPPNQESKNYDDLKYNIKH